MPTEQHVRFYTVQDDQDRRRLEAGGEPWPTGFSRAFVGFGFYAWASVEDAEAYQSVLVDRGANAVMVVAFEIESATLATLRTFDLTRSDDAEANNWLHIHSAWAEPARYLPHGYDHVIRGTTNGRYEHYFSPAAFTRFRPVAG